MTSLHGFARRLILMMNSKEGTLGGTTNQISFFFTKSSCQLLPRKRRMTPMDFQFHWNVYLHRRWRRQRRRIVFTFQEKKIRSQRKLTSSMDGEAFQPMEAFCRWVRVCVLVRFFLLEFRRSKYNCLYWIWWVGGLPCSIVMLIMAPYWERQTRFLRAENCCTFMLSSPIRAQNSST